ncbi:hypothetical protein [Streptomyces sp. NPDC060031]|uniref:hypothetical protein n=1 Tax=Streptomyces sp. NPDC060031 TaxID=3347043 RepID=UPI0036BDE237
MASPGRESSVRAAWRSSSRSAGVRGGGEPVGGGSDAPPGALVVGPAVGGPAQRGGLVLREHREQLVGAGVRGGDEGLGEVVHGEAAVGVRERLGGGGDGGSGAAEQPPLVGEPGAEQGLYEPGVADEAATRGGEVAVVAGEHPAEQVEAVGLGQAQPVPEPAAELLLTAGVGDVLGQGVQDGQERPGGGGAQQGLVQQPRRRPVRRRRPAGPPARGGGTRRRRRGWFR